MVARQNLPGYTVRLALLSMVMVICIFQMIITTVYVEWTGRPGSLPLQQGQVQVLIRISKVHPRRLKFPGPWGLPLIKPARCISATAGTGYSELQDQNTCSPGYLDISTLGITMLRCRSVIRNCPLNKISLLMLQE